MRCFSRFFSRLAVLIFVSTLLLTGCSSLKENTDRYAITVKPEEKTTDKLNYYPSFYVADNFSDQISSFTKLVELENWNESAKTILAEAFKEASARVFGTFADFISLEDMYFTGDVLNLYLDSSIYINDQKRFELSTLITNTMVRNFDINYVNFVLDETGVGINGNPLGLCEYREGSLSELYEAELSNIQENADSYMKNFGIYFVDDKDGYIIPEVRSVTVNNGVSERTMFNLLYELSKGPSVYTSYYSSLDQTYIRNSILSLNDEKLKEFISYKDGNLILYNAKQIFKLNENNVKLNLYASAIYCTLKGLVPDMKRMTFVFQNKVISVDDFKAYEYLGDIVSIYLPSESMSYIEKVDRVISSRDSLDENKLIELISLGKISGDPVDVISVFPGGLTKDDVIGLSYSDDCLELDFSEDFIVSMGRLTDKGVHLMIYSLVDTMCQIAPVKRVQFLVEGKRVESIEHVNVSLKSPLLFNPGIIKK